MKSNKVYESIIFLLNNIIKNERLKYFLIKNVEFRNNFLKQVNSLLTLEKDFEQDYQEIQWSTVFGKAIVKLTAEKIRLEKVENAEIDSIYAQYSEFISYVGKTYEVDHKDLLDQTGNLSQEVVLLNAKLSKEQVENFDKAENLKEESVQPEVEKVNPENITFGGGIGSNSNQGFNQQQFGQGPFGGPASGLPIHPMQNPYFYAFDRKNKYMPIMKMILAIISSIAAVLLIITMSLVVSFKAEMSNTEIDKIFGGLTESGKLYYQLPGRTSYQLVSIGSLPLSVSNQTMNWLSYVLYILPPLYLWLDINKKVRVNGKTVQPARTKYRVGTFTVVFLVVVYGIVIFTIYRYVSVGNFKSLWWSFFENMWKNLNGTALENKVSPEEFNLFWSKLTELNGSKFATVTSMAIVALVFIVITVVYGIGLLVINPRPDREKIMRANNEYQKAVMAAMQGQKYEMDPSLFEKDENES
ncbi:hypothetical protein CXP39_02150 [Mesoplasma syrphidae]|uniref:Uncharacterized protein n=1 Tax=Mesoplasma syrphidae TaxID=225999 RepID=A0A2K9CD64_9MOLU|nr:hypothetical protein [Mesoplasma syrphidae]AUF83594.1 hypothetical protein CXP39_02150 [Mesoplasma syrphidae]